MQSAADPPVSADEAPAAIGASATRKATLHIIPLIALGYGIAFMDRVNISFAALQMNRDLHFTATTYGFGAGLFFLSYAACEIPSNLLLCRFGARRWLARIMVTWGILAMAMLFVRTPAQFYTMRFLLGMAEAGFFPGAIFYLMQWFPPELRARAISRFYISLPISSVLMGMIAGALLQLNGRLGLAGWQWLFLVEGLPAVVLGIVFLLALPDSPAHAKWLTAAERSWITHHIPSGNPHDPSHPHESIRHALLDPRVLQLGLFMMLMLTTSYGYIFIIPQLLLDATHLSTTKIGFIIAALSLLGVPAMLLGAIYSDRAQTRTQTKARTTAQPETQNRYWHIIPFCLLISSGLLLCGLFPSPRITLPALGLVFSAFYAMQGPLWSLPPSLFQGRSAAAAIAAANTLAITGGFIGPAFMGFARDLSGNYQRGLLILSLPMLFGAGIMLYMRNASLHQQTPHALPVHAAPPSM